VGYKAVSEANKLLSAIMGALVRSNLVRKNPMPLGAGESKLRLINCYHSCLFSPITENFVTEPMDTAATGIPPSIGGPRPQPVTTAFDLIGLTDLRKDTQFQQIDGSGFAVVVIDTGIDATHPDLINNFLAFADFRNSSSPRVITNPRNTLDTDADGHGTHVAGKVGSTLPEIGVATGVDLIALQVFETRATVDDNAERRVANALQWVLRNRERYNITAVNLSLTIGNLSYTSPRFVRGRLLLNEIQQLEAVGVTIVAAAGNNYEADQQENLGLPGIISSLAVGAVDNGDRLANFSQRLQQDNMIFAPGVDINSTVPGGGFASFSGTSQAAPQVTGAVALLQDAAVRFRGEVFTTSEVVTVINQTADTIFDGDDEDTTVRATRKNYRRLNIYKAVQETQQQGIIRMSQYGASYTDLITTIGYDPVALADHYFKIGRSQGRSLDSFDEVNYLASNPDLIIPINLDATKLARHYIELGFTEGRVTNSFDVFAYLASNSDLIPIFNTDLSRATLHYINTGYQQGRLTNSFAADQYLASNTDLITLYSYNLNAATQHYVNFGFTENRAVDNFDEINYLAANRDLSLEFGLNSTLSTRHYIQFGFSENRPLTGFDPLQYLASYPDLIFSFGNNTNQAIIHYISNGVLEGRGADQFDESRYLASNPDLITVFGTNLNAATQHYVDFGAREGRSTASFDSLRYIASYDDLTRTLGENIPAGTEHYLKNGFQEGRNPSLFNASIYIASYGDLISSIGYNPAEGIDHYLNFGANEGRSRNIFNPVSYLQLYPDLQANFGGDLEAATRHYIQFGFYEGRTF